jgi:DNA repair exonuclease SbcCD ATPase subunit
MSYRIERIEVEGFRGFRKRKELKLGENLVIVSGPQRSGKSSLLNAPVWALVGSEAEKKELGPVPIRERVRWIARNLETDSTRVKILFRGSQGEELVVGRSDPKGKVTVERDGREIKKGPLEVLGLTLDGLVSSVFLPQEVIRAALSLEPKKRQAIFIQLAGLENLSTLEGCLENARKILEDKEKKIAELRKHVDGRIGGQVSLQKRRVKELWDKVLGLGLSEEVLSPDGARPLVEQSLKGLADFCSNYGEKMPSIPEVRGPEDLPQFVNEMRGILFRLEAESPETRRQRDLYERKRKIEALISDLEELEEKKQKINASKEEILKPHGKEEELKIAIQELEKTLEGLDREIERGGKYLKMVEEALSYFETLPQGLAQMECPVCRKAKVSVAHVREHLASEIEKAGLEPLRNQRQEIEKTLKGKKAAQEALIHLAEQEKKLEAMSKELLEKASELRGREIAPNESLGLVLKNMAQATEKGLEELKGIIEARGRAIQGVRAQLEKLGLVVELHREKKRLAELDEIPQTPQYKAFIETEDKIHMQIALLKELLKGLEQEKMEAFRQRFADLKDEVNDLYRRLLGREDFSEVWIDEKDWEVKTRAGDRQPTVIQVFNVGDMTAVALALFLASAMRANHQAGFVLLDDPIQSLDEEHERRLAEILADLAQKRQVIVSCSRSSFVEALEDAGTVKRQVIRLAPWDESRTCRLQGEERED